MEGNKEPTEKLRDDGIPMSIVSEVENYLINGRPELSGAMEKGLTSNVDRSRSLGARGGLCGFAASYASEVVERMNKDEGYNLAGTVIQAELLGKIAKGDLYRNFRRHGFSIIVDRDSEKWWIVDTALNQFVEEVDGGGLIMGISKLKINNVARDLLKNGYVEMTKENLAGYIALMVTYGSVNAEYVKKMVESLSKNPTFKLDDLLTYCVDDVKWRVGDWDGSLSHDIW